MSKAAPKAQVTSHTFTVKHDSIRIRFIKGNPRHPSGRRGFFFLYSSGGALGTRKEEFEPIGRRREMRVVNQSSSPNCEFPNQYSCFELGFRPGHGFQIYGAKRTKGYRSSWYSWSSSWARALSRGVALPPLMRFWIPAASFLISAARMPFPSVLPPRCLSFASS